MSSPTTKCPACNFENHSTSGFCISCGKRLATEGMTRRKQKQKPSTVPDPPDPTTRPLDTTKALIERIVKESTFKYNKMKGGWVLAVPIGSDRTQRVHVMYDGQDDDDEEMISTLSVCGPATDKYAMALLTANAKISYCAYAVRKIKGESYFVVSASQLASTADADEVIKQIVAVGKHADMLEQKLGNGEDRF